MIASFRLFSSRSPWRAPKKRLKPPAAVLLLVLYASCATAGVWDYNAFFATRSKPLAGSFSGQLGYDVLLWGHDADHDFKYGYIRPDITGRTSVVVNVADVHLAFFPISFLGVGAGLTGSNRQTTLDTADCDRDACEGTLQSRYADTRLTLGYGNFFFTGQMRWAVFTPGDATRPFVDEYTVLTGAPGGDTLFYRDQIAGYKINDDTVVGLLFSQATMIAQQTANATENAFVKRRLGRVDAILGAGAYSSSTQGLTATVFGAVQWTGKPSLALH